MNKWGLVCLRCACINASELRSEIRVRVYLGLDEMQWKGIGFNEFEESFENGVT